MQHYVEHGYNADELENIFDTAARIMRGWYSEDKWGKTRRIGRVWHAREQAKYPLHSVVKKAMRMSRPDDWQLLLLQWPHQSMTDQSRLAYTRDERSGEADKQVITSIGKYLRAHFSKLPDHAIRDLVATNTTADFKFVNTTAEMLYHLHRGPRSCMVWDSTDHLDEHPYNTYDPALGWHMAIRIVDGQTVGRALCNTDEDGTKYFVRSYKRDPENPSGYSHADEQLVAWLREMGYAKYDGYPNGTKLKLIPTKRNDAGFIAPYIDGSIQHVKNCGDHLRISEDGDWECDSTDGNPSDSSGEVCEDCDSRFSEGDGYWVGRYEDRRVCSTCCDDNYRYAYGRNGNQYYEHVDDCTWSEEQGEYYVESYLCDNNMVFLSNGELVHHDNAVDVDGDWYHVDDERICYDSYNECYAMLDDCVELANGDMCAECDAWQCAESGDWYTNDEDYELIDGEKVHPDHAPQDEGEVEDEVVSIGASPDQPQIVATPTTYQLPPDDERFALVA